MNGQFKYYAINYEGGKIVEHALQSNRCLAYANIQIAMDAPYNNIVATKEIRSLGPMEKQLEGYDNDSLLLSINNIFDYIMKNYPSVLIVIQIARGKAASNMISDLKPILTKLYASRNEYIIKSGYRSNEYFEIPEKNFILVNIGMIARLTNIDDILPGTVCNSQISIDIKLENDDLVPTKIRMHTDNKNILNNTPNIPKIILFGIEDFMPFVTPDIYPIMKLQNLINNIDKELLFQL
jgi:hypothetical protein